MDDIACKRLGLGIACERLDRTPKKRLSPNWDAPIGFFAVN
ncbi:MAG: hypothetical protein WBA89_06075 [Microcoleus sp.]